MQIPKTGQSSSTPVLPFLFISSRRYSERVAQALCVYVRADEPQPKFPEINHKECQEPVSRPQEPVTHLHSHEKNQMYMIWEGTGSAVWLMSHGCDGLQIAQWNRQKLLARVSHLSRREVPHRILLAHLPRTLPPAQSFCTAGRQLWFLVSKLSKEHQNLLLRG